jgi:hypothetical protein
VKSSSEGIKIKERAEQSRGSERQDVYFCGDKLLNEIIFCVKKQSTRERAAFADKQKKWQKI